MSPSPDPSRRPRAVFFCTFPPPVTGQTIGTELTRRLVEDRFDTTVFDTSGGEFVVGGALPARLGRLVELLRHMNAMVRHLESDRPEVLYLVAAGSPAGHLRDVLTILRARRRVGRIVAHVRSGEFPRNFGRWWHRALTRLAFSRVDCFILLSEDLARQVAADIPAERRAVIPNCIDDAVRCSDEEVAAKLAARRRRSSFRILYLANMIPAKGYHDVAAALETVIRGHPETRFEAEFAGAWPSDRDRREFERLLEGRKLSRATRLHGGVADRGEVKEMLLRADVMALPTYYPEAQPRSIIEAMNAATPIIATRQASIPEYVFAGENGYLVEPRSPGQIAAALEELLEPATWRSRAEASRRVYLEKFDLGRIRPALLAAFRGETPAGGPSDA